MGLTQEQILVLVSPEQPASNRSLISQFENNLRVPSLDEIRNYARLAGVPVEVLADDALNLTDSFYGAGRAIDEDIQQISLLPEIAPNPAEAEEKPPVSAPLPPIKDSRRITSAETDDDLSVSKQCGGESSAPVGEIIIKMTTEDADHIISAPPDESLTAGFTSPSATSEKPVLSAAEAPAEMRCGRVHKLSIELDGQLLARLGEIYLALLPEIPCHRWAHLPFDLFIEQMLRTMLADYDERGAGSAIAGRVRSFGNSTGDDDPRSG